MSTESLQLKPVAPLARLACAAGSMVATGFIVAALLGAFHGQSPSQWLRPSPELMEMAGLCQDLPGRAERTGCLKRVVAARLAREQQAATAVAHVP